MQPASRTVARLLFRLRVCASALPRPRSFPLAALTTRAELAARAAAASAPFAPLASALFERIVVGVAGVAAANDGFTVSRSASGVSLRARGGSPAFDVTADAAARTVSFCAPKTGQRYAYAYDAVRGWVCTTDGHLLLEMLARELVYHCKGFPDF